MKDFFDNHKDACVTTLDLLGNLTDGNCLKPTCWAEHSKDPEKHCGFSLGVRHFVRPLYLYIKLRDLREYGDNGVKLEDVNVYKCIDKAHLERNPSLTEHKSKYKNRKNGTPRSTRGHCKSCEIFFGGRLHKRKKNKQSLDFFGYCAEYDVIKTNKLDYLLRSIESWRNFESASRVYLEALNSLTKKIGESLDRHTLLMKYFQITLDVNVNVLKYEYSSESYNYELKAMNWELELSYTIKRQIIEIQMVQRNSVSAKH